MAVFGNVEKVAPLDLGGWRNNTVVGDENADIDDFAVLVPLVARLHPPIVVDGRPAWPHPFKDSTESAILSRRELE